VAGIAMKYIVLSILLSIVAVFGVEAAEGKEKLGTFSLYFNLFAEGCLRSSKQELRPMIRNVALTKVLGPSIQ